MSSAIIAYSNKLLERLGDGRDKATRNSPFYLRKTK